MKNKILILLAVIFAGCNNPVTQAVEDAQKEYDSYVVDFSFAINGKTVTFTNRSDSRLDASRFTWWFGDDKGVEGVTNPTHTYANAGSYEATLIAQLPSGQKKKCFKTVVIDGTTQPDPMEQLVAYFEYKMVGFKAVDIKDMSEGKKAVYDFGDGETREIDLPYDYLIYHGYNKNGTYTIKVTVTGNSGTTKTYQESVVIRDPKIYMTGIEYISVGDAPNEYYRAKLIDDDIFTTTWWQTNYTSTKLSSANVPFMYTFSSPVEMNGLDEDDYYELIVHHNTKNSGDGTQCLKQTIYTSVIKAQLPYIEVKNTTGNTVVRLHMKYE